jgi:quinol monooxygenase YgiN
MHVFVRFEPLPGKEQRLREELRQIMEPTRAEPGCLRIHLYESLREPLTFFVHSEWKDEAAFDAHPKLPHMRRFLATVSELIGHKVLAVRTKQME